MYRKIILIIIFFTPIFSFSFFAFANLEINEIMYDLRTGGDDGREWVEIHNNSDAPIDVSILRFSEADTNHKLKLVQGGTIIGAHDFALIVSDSIKFKVDHPAFAGTVFDSSFSLSNSGEVLALKNTQQGKDLNVIDQFVYSSSMGGAGDGKSLQKVGGVWKSAIPTPGSENKIIVVVPLPVVRAEIVPKKVAVVPKNEPAVTKGYGEAKEKVKNASASNNMSASALESNVIPKNSNSYIFVIIFILLLCISTGAVYFIRKNREPKEDGSDFEILEE